MTTDNIPPRLANAVLSVAEIYKNYENRRKNRMGFYESNTFY